MLRRRPEVLALGALLAVYVSWFALDWIPGDSQKLQILFLAPVDALVVYACLRASRRTAETPWLRRFWLYVMAAWAFELTADLILAIYDIALEDPTFPSVGDLFYLCFYPLLILALLQLPTAPATRSQQLRSALDCATIVLGGGAAIWYFVLGEALTAGAGSFAATAVSVAYPIGDLILLGGLALVFVRGYPPVLKRPLWLIAAGLTMLIVADTIYGHQQLQGTYSPGDLVDVLFVLLAAPFAVAAASQRRSRGAEATGAVGWVEAERRVSRLPLLAVAMAIAILVGTNLHDRFFPDFSLLIFVILIGALSVARQYLGQRDLLQLQGRMRTIVESAADGIVTFGEDGRIVWVNPAAEQAFQAGPGELEGEPIESLFEGVAWAEMAANLGIGGGPDTAIGRRLKLSGRSRDGETFPLEMIVSDARLDGERVLIAVGQDVSERVRGEAALRESERRFRGIFDHAGTGIVFSSFAGGQPRIVESNAAFSAILGYSAQELSGHDFSLITHPDDFGVLAEISETIAGGEDRIAMELRCLCKDRSTVWCALTISVLRDEAGAPVSAIGMMNDVSQRREAERAKDEFVSVVGHELRTPLTAIRGSLGLLEGGVLGALPEEASQMLGTAVSSTDRLVRLINDMLDLERIDSGRDGLALVPVAAATLVGQSVEVVQAVADEAGVTIETEVDDVAVAADPDRVVQALINLLGNAIKFSEPGGAVAVGAAPDGDWALFSVRDSGRGIPADQLDSIFERFRQVDASDSREKGGTGLGLAISRSIVEHHGGRIWAESSPGQGSTFRFTLPAAAAVGAAAGDGGKPL